MDIKADTPCQNCGRDFADHNYVKDSIDKYLCPHPYVETVYGFYHGGDPRTFHPDADECSDTELTNHRKACELWDEAEAQGETPETEKCPSGFIYDDKGKCLGHALLAPYGIGVSQTEWEQYFEPCDEVDHD